MKFAVRRSLVTCCVLFLVFASTGQAFDALPSADPHVRVLEPCRANLLREAVRLSPTVRELVDILEQSDLVVYVRCTTFKDSTLTGRLSFLASVAGRRYVVIEVKLHEQYGSLIATLAHELQHAVEVASAPSIRDSATMAKHYRLIGMIIDRHPQVFETMAARAVGERVHRELLGVSVNARAAETSTGSR